MSLRHMAISVLLVSALFLLTSCNDSCTNPGGDSGCDEHIRATAEGTVEAFARSMEAMDIDAYSECLADTYRYRFTPQDAEDAGLPPDEPWWGKTEDIQSTGSLFSDPYVSKVESELPIDDPDGGESMTLWVFKSWLHLEIRPDEHEAGLWQITGIREEMKPDCAGGEAPATEATTLGSIKVLYRLPS